jgi:hypothetical protein
MIDRIIIIIPNNINQLIILTVTSCIFLRQEENFVNIINIISYNHVYTGQGRRHFSTRYKNI